MWILHGGELQLVSPFSRVCMSLRAFHLSHHVALGEILQLVRLEP